MSESGHRGARRTIGVPRERTPGETRVALLPPQVEALVHDGLDVLVETGAGDAAGATDDAYRAVGAQIVDGLEALHDRADIVARVRVPANHDDSNEPALLRQGQTLIGLLDPPRHAGLMADLAERGVDAHSLDAVAPGVAGLTVDAAASQGAVAGYQAALLAATTLGRRFGRTTTPSGSLPPARVLVLGGGVEAMHAVTTARRLGAEVTGHCTDDAGRDLIASLGASMLSTAVDIAVADADVVICADPGGGTVLSGDAVRGMTAGSVVVDLGAVPGRPGGGCALSRSDETVNEHGVTILAPTHAARFAPVEASHYLSHNVRAFVAMLVAFDKADVPGHPVLAGAAIVVAGEVLHGATREALGLPALERRDAASDDAPTDDPDTAAVGDDDDVIALGEPDDAPETGTVPEDVFSDLTGQAPSGVPDEPAEPDEPGEPDEPAEPAEDSPPRWSFLLEDAPERESGDGGSEQTSADDPADPSAWWTTEPSDSAPQAPPDDAPPPDDQYTEPYRPASPPADAAWWMRDDDPVEPVPTSDVNDDRQHADAADAAPPVNDGVRWDATDDDIPAPDATARHEALPPSAGEPRRERRWPFGPRDRRDDEPGGTS